MNPRHIPELRDPDRQPRSTLAATLAELVDTMQHIDALGCDFDPTSDAELVADARYWDAKAWAGWELYRLAHPERRGLPTTVSLRAALAERMASP